MNYTRNIPHNHAYCDIANKFIFVIFERYSPEAYKSLRHSTHLQIYLLCSPNNKVMIALFVSIMYQCTPRPPIMHSRDFRSFRGCNNHTKDLSSRPSVARQLSEREREKECTINKIGMHFCLSLRRETRSRRDDKLYARFARVTP